MAGGNRISATTVRRWVIEVIGLLAARAERLDPALKKVTRKGGHVVLLDGTLIRTQRRTGADNRRNYSDKHKAHSLLFLALTDDKGKLSWLSAARLGPRSSEITTARCNNSSSACGPPSWVPSATSASLAWTTAPTTQRSSRLQGRPHQAPHRGEAGLLSAGGLDPRSTLVKVAFVGYATAYLAAGITFAARVQGAWWAVLLLAVLGLWDVPFGAVANLVVIALLPALALRTRA